MHVFHVVGQDRSTWGTLAGSWRGNGTARTQIRVPIQDAGTTGASLTCYATMQLTVSIFLNVVLTISLEVFLSNIKV